jgi:hypothetical protein
MITQQNPLHFIELNLDARAAKKQDSISKDHVVQTFG